MQKLTFEQLKPKKVLTKEEQKTVIGGQLETCTCAHEDGSTTPHHMICEGAQECMAMCNAICGAEG